LPQFHRTKTNTNKHKKYPFFLLVEFDGDDIMNEKLLAAVLFICLAYASCLAVTPAQALSQAAILPNYNGYLDLTTIPITYHVVGEINNTGNISLRLLQVTATFYGPSNSLVGSNSSYAFLEALLPAMKTPFEVVWVGETANQIHNYTLTLEYNEYTGQEKPPALQVLANSTYIDQAGFLKLNGTIKNMGTSNATYVKAVATFYQTDGKVEGATYDYTLPSTIMPNSDAFFELELKRNGVTISSCIVTAESEEYTIVQEFPSPILMLLTVLTLTIVFALKHKRAQRDRRKSQSISQPFIGESG
jgi:hypothetical protein